LEILELVPLGKSNKEVAAALFISEGTVKNHLYRIMRKLGVGNRTEVALRLSEFDRGRDRRSEGHRLRCRAPVVLRSAPGLESERR
jgi:predicted transcriptional regulator